MHMTKNILLCQLREYAVFYRLGRPLEVSKKLTPLLEKLHAFTCSHSFEEQKEMLDHSLSILKCQENEDWLGLADCIEYDLYYFLNRI